MTKVTLHNSTVASPKIVRALFEEKMKYGGPQPPGSFHPLDLARVNDDRYLMRIIVHVENNVQDAVDLLWDILVWRTTVGANDINENNIRMDYINEGSIFPYGRDIDGCLLLVFKFKLYRKSKKNLEEVKKILIYWLDRIEREEDGNRISIFCDMSDSGVTAIDIQLSNYVTTLLRRYYPYFLNYVIVFQMHWSLSSTFKMIKSLLPPKVASRLKFVTRNTLGKVVQLNHALKCWGGTDDFEFEFVSENKSGSYSTQLTETKLYNDMHSHAMIHVKPNNTIIFRGSNNKPTFCMMLTVTNTHESAIFFEIRTTTPDMFCITPNVGTLDVSRSKSVVIVQDYFDQLTLNALTSEKFMIIAIQIPHTGVTKDELYEIWQTSPNFKTQEYTFKHLLSKIDDSSTFIPNSLTDLRLNNETIQNQLHFLKLYQLLTLIIVTFAAFVFCFQHIWS